MRSFGHIFEVSLVAAFAICVRGSFSGNPEADYEVRHAEVRTWQQSGEQTENEIILCSGYISFQVSLELSEPGRRE